MRRILAIAVRSVKAGMTRFGHLRSRLKDGAKPGCKAAAIEPPCSDACTVFMQIPMPLGVRNFTYQFHTLKSEVFYLSFTKTSIKQIYAPCL
ncbi:hypothetical protein HMPREF0864_04693 [Enterobacteriaceae bacterium 9_2_54FAA]|nr:hypothetical protein HMPREF0864_04693 [Enterobacteriaceae bacterium 9_2_54FAA]